MTATHSILSVKSPPLRLSAQARSMVTSATLAINEKVAEKRAWGHDIIHLGFGQASFPLHPKLSKALGKSAKHTDYAPVLGIEPLRCAIADYLQANRNFSCSADQIIVGPGSKPLLYALLQVLEGDLLLPLPCWVSYMPQAQLAGKRVIGVETDATDRTRITTTALSQALAKAHLVGADPRILLLTSPNNPTGSMFDEADVKAIALWAKEHDFTVISDEIYAELAHGWRKHVSPAVFYPEGCIVTGGISKVFSAGGWRLGYAALPPGKSGQELRRGLQALASEIWSAASTPVQEAAVTAFVCDPEIESYISASAYLHGFMAKSLYTSLIQLGVKCPRPAGGFYIYANFGAWRLHLAQEGIETSEQLALYLLDKWNIATLPGSEFGDKPENLSLRLATSMLFGDDGESNLQSENLFWSLHAGAQCLNRDANNGAQSVFPALNKTVERFTQFVQTIA
jgi:aspartate aminotransferase